MTPAEGKKRVHKLLGTRAMWRDSGRTTSPEQRERAQNEQRQARAAVTQAKDAMNARLAELQKDPEYVRLVAAYKEAYRAERESGKGGGYRLMAGVDMGIACEVKAEGDNWAELVRALESRAPGQLTSARLS
jgi:nucleoid-associated protein YgaU